MAEVVGLVASAVTLAATAHGAAKFAKALFKVTTTFKHARREMADIAQRLSQFSTSLQVLADILRNNETLCRHELHANTTSIIKGWEFVEAELTRLLESPSSLKRFMWTVRKPVVRPLLKTMEGIEKALMMELSILQLAVLVKAQANHTLSNVPAVDPATTQRKITESVVQANRQVVESAQHDIEEEKPFDPLNGKRAELDLRKQYTFDTATWLYHFVFGPSMLEPHTESSHQPSVSDDDAGERNGTVVLPSPDQMMSTSREIIVWGSGTEPSVVVNRLLSAWTTLSAEQITANSVRNEDDKWTQRFLKMLQQTKDGEDMATDSDTDGVSVIDAYAEGSDQSTGKKKRRAHDTEPAKRFQRSSQSNLPAAPPPRQVNFRTTEEKPPKYTGRSTPTPEPPSRPKSTQAHSVLPTAPERLKRHSQSTPSPRYPQYPPPRVPAPFAPNAANMHSYTDPPYRQRYSMSNTTVPPHNTTSAWNPFIHMLPTYPSQQSPPTPVTMTPAASQQSQETGLTSAERAIRTAITDDPRLSRIESLLSAQQDNLAQIKQTHVHDSGEVKSIHLSNASEKYGKIIEGLEKLLTRQKEDLQRTEADISVERGQLAATTEAYDSIIHALEQLLAQQNGERSHAEEAHRHEVKALKDQADRAVEAKEIAVRDAAAAQSAAEKAKEHLNSVKVEIKAEKVMTERREAEIAKAKCEADEDNAKKFQLYEKLLKASRQAPQKKSKPLIHQPARQTRLVDRYHSIEVNEFVPDASDSLPALLFSPVKFLQNNTRRSDPDVQYYESSLRPARERHNSFHSSPTSVQSPRLPLAAVGRAGGSRESQQMLLLPAKVDQSSIGTLQLQQYLDRSGIAAVFDDPQDAVDATGRTYFHGDQPIHSYFFKPDYTPQFLPPTCPTPQDILMIDGALIEEYALIELDFKFTRTVTAEYELDGWLTFGDIEGLIERSFLLRENRYRAHYRRPSAVQQWLKQPTTPTTQTTFSQDDAPSGTSTTSRSSGSRHSNTERGQGGDVEFDTSHTSQRDAFDEQSVFEQSDDAERPPSVASWVKMTTNPFRRSTSSGMAESSKNPYQQGSLEGPSLIDL